MTCEPADAELMKRWNSGDQLAGTELLSRHSAALYDFLRWRVPAEVDDVAQQTLLVCIERQRGFRGEASFRTFMLSIARYQVYAQYRARQRVHGVDPTQLRALVPSPSQQLSRARDEHALSLALARLPQIFREVLELAFFEELDSFQIAERLSIPAPTARSRQRRALIRLRKVIAGREMRG